MKLFAFLVLGEPKNPFLKRYHFTTNPGGPANHTGSNISVITHIEYGKDGKIGLRKYNNIIILWAEYSSGSISRLYKEGIRDTLNKLLEKEIIEEIDSLANKSQSDEEKETLTDLANYIPRIMGNEDSKFESYNFNELPSIIKQIINETRQVKQKELSTSNTERILDRIDQSGAKYIEVFRVCLDYDHASPYSLTISE
jgi:hypothetical protein